MSHDTKEATSLLTATANERTLNRILEVAPSFPASPPPMSELAAMSENQRNQELNRHAAFAVEWASAMVFHAVRDVGNYANKDDDLG